jgi:hypothetical protein
MVPLVFLGSLFALVFYMIAYPNYAVKKRLKYWADANDLVVTRAERRLLSAGPFLWKRSGIVFRIEVQTPVGQRRTGWIRFGFDIFARETWSDTAVWDDVVSKW